MHYYEDGNVRLTTSKSVVSASIPGSATGPEVMKEIAQIEKKYQEELNRGFTALSEGTFKGLRRQLPVTRQKVEWEKVGGYRVRLCFLLTGYVKLAADCVTARTGYRWWEATVRIERSVH